MIEPIRNLKLPSFATLLATAALLMLVLISSCDASGPSGPKGPGALHFHLQSPNGTEGSAVFELTGAMGLGPVSSDFGQVFYDHAGGGSRVVVIMDNPGQIRFQVRADNVREIPEVQILQVADGGDELRDSLVGYEVSVRQVKDGGAP